MSVNFRTQHPMQLVERMLCINNIREIGVDKISQLDKKHHVFLIKYDDGGQPDIAWEFCLFEATTHQFNSLFEQFVSRPKKRIPTQDKVQNLVITEDKPEIVDKPKLII